MSKFRSRLPRYNIFCCDQIMPVPVFPRCAIPECKPQPICQYTPNNCPTPPNNCCTIQLPNCTSSPLTNNAIQIPNYDPTLPPPPTGTILTITLGLIPNGYLLCDGSAVSRTTYSALFTVIGTTYTPDSTPPTQFNLPNLMAEEDSNQKMYIIKI